MDYGGIVFILFFIFLGLFQEGSPWKTEAQQRSCYLRPSHPAEECPHVSHVQQTHQQ